MALWKQKAWEMPPNACPGCWSTVIKYPSQTRRSLQSSATKPHHIIASWSIRATGRRWMWKPLAAIIFRIRWRCELMTSILLKGLNWCLLSEMLKPTHTTSNNAFFKMCLCALEQFSREFFTLPEHRSFRPSNNCRLRKPVSWFRIKMSTSKLDRFQSNWSFGMVRLKH